MADYDDSDQLIAENAAAGYAGLRHARLTKNQFVHATAGGLPTLKRTADTERCHQNVWRAALVFIDPHQEGKLLVLLE